MNESNSGTSSQHLTDALDMANVLETFHRLPQEHQTNFVRWVGKAPDTESEWRRIDALVMALRMSALTPTTTQDQAAEGPPDRSVGRPSWLEGNRSSSSS